MIVVEKERMPSRVFHRRGRYGLRLVREMLAARAMRRALGGDRPAKRVVVEFPEAVHDRLVAETTVTVRVEVEAA